MAEISENELNERILILRKFRGLLEMQRQKFRDYLAVLEKQQDSINAENAEIIAAHTELEQQVVKGIINLQKVIVPMSEMYKNSAQGTVPEEEKHVKAIQEDLNRLQEKVLAQNEKNRELLRSYLVQLREQIETFNNPYTGKQSVYAGYGDSGNLIAVEA